MKIARVAIGTQIVLVTVNDDSASRLAIDTNESWADPLRVWLESGRPTNANGVIAFSETKTLAPVRSPQKIVCVGLNYKDHAAEQGKDLPTAPMLFAKAPSAIIGPEDDITYAKATSTLVDYEGEVGVIIGTRAQHVSVESALDYVLGYTICNDVTARDLQKSDGQFFRAKSFDTFCPIGPWIVTADEIADVQNLRVQTRVNGETRQDGNTSDMVFSVAEIISHASRYFTLEPGDVIATGTPAGVGAARTPPVSLVDGDTVEIEVEGIGVLRNRVRVL